MEHHSTSSRNVALAMSGSQLGYTHVQKQSVNKKGNVFTLIKISKACFFIHLFM